jgi:hypothetical protein
VDKGYHNGREIAQCINNNITTIVAHPQEKQRKCHATGLFVAKFKYNAENDSYNAPRRTLKLQEDGIKKSGRTESGINLKIPNSSPLRMSSKTPLYV